jgi:hypothetical protein
MNQSHASQLGATSRQARPEEQHRPTDEATLAREACRLANQGLTVRDIAAALRIGPTEVHRALQAAQHAQRGAA